MGTYFIYIAVFSILRSNQALLLHFQTLTFHIHIMMKYIIAGLCFIVLVTADIADAPDYSAFLIAASEELPGNSANNDAFPLIFDGNS